MYSKFTQRAFSKHTLLGLAPRNWLNRFAMEHGLVWRRQWHPTTVLLPGKSHGWRSLVGYSPWGREASDATEQLHFHFSLSCSGEGNGNPLQCSCLENPRDGGVWWAAVYGVTQSRAWLKWLSSSSSVYMSVLISQFIHPPCILSIYNFICQLYINKAGKNNN